MQMPTSVKKPAASALRTKRITVKKRPSVGARRRYGPLPAPDVRADLYWGASQPELRGVTNAQLTKLILGSPEFERVFGPRLDQIDERNRTVRGTTKMGRPARWSARRIEALLVYRRVSGLSTVKRARAELQLDPEAQLLLGLGQEIPSAPTITRYTTQHFEPQERARLYRELDRQLRQRVIDLPGFDKEARILGIDGSQHGTHYTPPIPETKKGKATGRIINAKIPPGERRAITAPDAGMVGGDGPKSGQGWQFVGLFTEHGTLLGWDISALHLSEREAATRVLDSYEREVLPSRSPTTISVCSADGGFSSPRVRQRFQDLRIVPNIHRASHAKSEESQRNAEKRNKRWLAFVHPSKPHYANWSANGHAEISCKCGQGQTERINRVGKSGKLTIATRGSCETCGSVTITSGRWRFSRNPSKYVLALGQAGDPAIGNSLTFNDHLAREYGQDRFGFGESVHQTIERRFGLLKDRSWMRSITQVETEFAIVGSAISALLLEREARRVEVERELAAAEATEIAAAA